MIVYKTTNLLNGKFYIGQDTKNNPKYLGSGTIIKIAIKKYGRESFIKEILEHCETQEQLNEREKHWIKVTNALELGYNLAEGGFGVSNMSNKIKQKISNSKKGKKLSDETKKRMRFSFSGRTHTEEAKHKLSEINRGKTLSEEHKRKIREANTGKKHTDECKKKISEKSKLFRHTEETKNKISTSHLGKKLSKETKQKIGEVAKGRKLSSEHKKILCSYSVGNQWNKGRIHTEETKLKISKSISGKTRSENTKKLLSEVQKTKKKVCQINPKTNEIIKIFNSINEASKELKISRMNLSTCLNHPNQRPIVGGFKWGFYKEKNYVQ